jgi:serine/threonine protein phosphatase 1
VGRTLIVGDVHSCAAELRILLERVKPTRVILVGDVFNKGPDPAGVWELVCAWNVEAVLGNHDLRVIALAEKGDVRAPSAAIAWLKTLPTFIEGDGWIVVHGGLNPSGNPTTKAQAVSLRRWPDDTDANHPFWWELYTGERLVVYGHDAVRGLVDHRPRTLGIDTGCVYGRQLTGYLLEADQLISADAQRVYRPV